MSKNIYKKKAVGFAASGDGTKGTKVTEDHLLGGDDEYEDEEEVEEPIVKAKRENIFKQGMTVEAMRNALGKFI